jgi:hypothetical protein
MTKARSDLLRHVPGGVIDDGSDPGTFDDRLSRIKEDLKFIAMRCVQEDDLVTAQQALAAADMVDGIELPAEVQEAEWNGLP